MAIRQRGYSLVAISVLACAMPTPVSKFVDPLAQSDAYASQIGVKWQGDVSVDLETLTLSKRSTRDRFQRVQYPQMVRCFTPQGMCWLPGSAPPGTPCWCATAYGPVAGRTG
jgi:hypothetical protein